MQTLSHTTYVLSPCSNVVTYQGMFLYVVQTFDWNTQEGISKVVSPTTKSRCDHIKLCIFLAKWNGHGHEVLLLPPSRGVSNLGKYLWRTSEQYFCHYRCISMLSTYAHEILECFPWNIYSLSTMSKQGEEMNTFLEIPLPWKRSSLYENVFF